MADNTTTLHRARGDDTPTADQPPTKRQKTYDSQAQGSTEVAKTPLLPPSHTLLGVNRHEEADEDGFTQMLETDVGISEYVGPDIPPIRAVIKQRPAFFSSIFTQNSYLNFRFTDFLVFEIDQNDRVLHLKSLGPPEPSSVPDASIDVLSQESASTTPQPPATSSSGPVPVLENTGDVSVSIEVQEGFVWSEDYAAVLEKFLSPPVINRLKQMYEEGPEPPFVSDLGWGSRQVRQGEFEVTEETPAESTSKRGRDSRGRGGRGGRAGNRGHRTGKKEDARRVVTDVRTFFLHIHITEQVIQPIADKAVRTELHKAIRQLFKGNLDSETDTTSANDDDGSRISIKWVGGGNRRGKNAGKSASLSLVPFFL
jgi:tRNA pseudouridine13 synthase